MRYIPVGGDAQFDRLAISVKFVTAERKVIPSAARNIPPPLCAAISDKLRTIFQLQYYGKLHFFY